MTLRAVPGGVKSVYLAISTLTFMSLPAGAICWTWRTGSDLQGSGYEASTKSRGVLAASPPKTKLAQALTQDNAAPQPVPTEDQPAPQMAQEPAPTMPDEAPHITPVPTERLPAPQMAPKPAPNQPTMPDEAPHITPTMEGEPGAATMQAPPQ